MQSRPRNIVSSLTHVVFASASAAARSEPDMIEGNDRLAFAHDGYEHDVYRAGSGPGVVVVRGMPGIIPEVFRYAGWFA